MKTSSQLALEAARAAFKSETPATPCDKARERNAALRAAREAQIAAFASDPSPAKSMAKANVLKRDTSNSFHVRMGAKVAPVAAPKPQHDAHVTAWRVASYDRPVTQCAPGRTLDAWRLGGRDRRSASPRGVTLVSPKLKGVVGRFSIH